MLLPLLVTSADFGEIQLELHLNICYVLEPATLSALYVILALFIDLNLSLFAEILQSLTDLCFSFIASK